MGLLAKLRAVLCLGVTVGLVAACGGGGDGSDVPHSGNDVQGAPSSIIGKTVVQTVTLSDHQGAMAEGGQITYSFVDANTVLGDGLATLETTSWNYSHAGNSGEVTLTYVNGESTDTYTFTSSTGGTYESHITFYGSGQTNWHKGTFTVSDYTGGVPPDGDDPTPTTGQVAFFTRLPDTGGPVSVSVDGAASGTLTQYFTSGTPTCGDDGTVTLTLEPGSHSFAGESDTYTWGPDPFTITAGECVTYELK
jgi:hypothetical protein